MLNKAYYFDQEKNFWSAIYTVCSWLEFFNRWNWKENIKQSFLCDVFISFRKVVNTSKTKKYTFKRMLLKRFMKKQQDKYTRLSKQKCIFPGI